MMLDRRYLKNSASSSDQTRYFNGNFIIIRIVWISCDQGLFWGNYVLNFPWISNYGNLCQSWKFEKNFSTKIGPACDSFYVLTILDCNWKLIECYACAIFFTENVVAFFNRFPTSNLHYVVWPKLCWSPTVLTNSNYTIKKNTIFK